MSWLRLSRPRDWATSKLPFITAVVLWTGTADMSLASVVAMMAAIATLAAFGYGVNEISDRSSDARAGKANRAAGMSGTSASLFLAITLMSSGAIVAAWASDLRAPAFWLFAVALSVAYSAPPIRLKERGFLGILAAAAAQWAFPVLLVSAACDPEAVGADSWLLALLGLAIGVRWMAVHQSGDVSGDRMSGVRTYASEGGAVAIVLSWAFRLELGLLLAAAIVSWPRSFTAGVALALWALKSMLAWVAGTRLREGIATYERAPLSDYYFLFLPVSLAVSRTPAAGEFVVLVPLFVLFGAGQILRVLGEWRLPRREPGPASL